MRDVFVQRLIELASFDSRIFLVTGDLGFGVLTEFERRFPRQYLNVGVAEQNMTGVATGLALEGRIVFTYSIANFSTLRCLEQIRNDVVYHSANVKIVAIGGGFSYGQLGMSHHATEDLAILRSLPLTVVAPGCNWEVAQLTNLLARLPGPCYFRLDKSTAGDTGRKGEQLNLGRARTLRDGSDVTLIASGGILAAALAAEEELSKSGVESRVLSMHTIKPLDALAIEAACRETGGLVTIEEHALDGGLGGAVAEVCLDRGFVPRGFHRIAIRHESSSSIVGSQEYLRHHYGLDAQSIVKKVFDLISGDDSARKAHAYQSTKA